MKFTSVVVALVAASSVQAASYKTPSTSIPKWCGHIGQGCKRSVDASLDVKRSAEELADSMAESLPQVLEKWCAHTGQGCHKAKRAANAVEMVKRTTDDLALALAALEDDE
ncbi:hypothetical protein N7457_009538 [Penicillium paradoxum]|uniref:uncharacterized protein n=1 Tax=Penicillium paradoxum TaxID=176176 RepID=UPI002547FCF5|nr:uncharacterized protein N7457_009538 [Penicillium paradoxum]KAJ5774642.1 hypothetical protein N7457_009538 [Penicillium paradoxum]